MALLDVVEEAPGRRDDDPRSGAEPAVHSALVCMTSNGVPTMPVSNPGQMVVQGT